MYHPLDNRDALDIEAWTLGVHKFVFLLAASVRLAIKDKATTFQTSSLTVAKESSSMFGNPGSHCYFVKKQTQRQYPRYNPEPAKLYPSLSKCALALFRIALSAYHLGQALCMASATA